MMEEEKIWLEVLGRDLVRNFGRLYPLRIKSLQWLFTDFVISNLISKHLAFSILNRYTVYIFLLVMIRVIPWLNDTLSSEGKEKKYFRISECEVENGEK